MRVGIIQSNYIPWRGYFDFIRSVDLFIVYDDVQYTKNDWRNRNQIKTATGLRWLTVPVTVERLDQLIQDTEISHAAAHRPGQWQGEHLNRFREAYRHAPYASDAIKLLEKGFAEPARTISELNVRLIRHISEYLGIHTELRFSRDIPSSGVRSERLVSILKRVGASSYLSGPSAAAYLEPAEFVKAGIVLEYKSYEYDPYPQLWGAFEGGVTVLDLIANCGPESRSHIASRAADVKAG